MTFLEKYSSHISITLKLAFPVIIGQLGQVLMGTIDIMMIGKLGYPYVSAAGLANNMFFLFMVFGFGIVSAVAPLVAEASAKNDLEKCREYLQQGTRVAVIAGIFFNIFWFFGADFIYLLEQPKQDIALATGFLKIISFSTVPMLVFLNFKQFADGLSDTKPAAILTTIGLSVNILLNYVLIEGKFGFPRMELNGAALGTTIARFIQMFLMIGWVMYGKRYEIYDLWKKWDEYISATFRKILAIGVPSGLQYFFEIGAFAGASVMIGWMGDEDTAQVYRSSHQIVINMAALTYMVAMGISSAAAIRVGDALGANDRDGMRRAGFSALFLVVAWMSFTAILFIVGRNFLPTLYDVTDPRVLATSAKLMIIGAFFQLFDGTQVVSQGGLRGLQDVNFPTITTFFAYWVSALPFGYLFGIYFQMGVEGVWYSFVLGLGISAILNTLRFWYLTK
jgi:multidrug resistance protein, MATE family